MSEDVVVTLVNQDSEDLDFPGVHQVREEEAADSASEGDIEIEHLVEDGGSDQQGGDDGGDPSQVTNITFDVRKRTLIMLWQRTILEEFYRAGMTSASMQLNSLHQAAADKTGLDCVVVKNWIRNRRRPAAIKSAERLVEKMSQGDSAPFTPPTSLTSLISSSSMHTATTAPIVAPSHLRTLPPGHMQSQAPGNAQGTTATNVTQQGLGLVPSEPKKFCLDQVVNVSRAFPSIPAPAPHISSIVPTTSCPLLIKIRVSGSGESDFYEVELPSPTYNSLLKACAEELEVEASLIAKIRKLPNILVRKDRDVQRLKEGQELEVVLKDDGNPLNIGGFCPGGAGGLSMLSLPPLSTDTPPLSGTSSMVLHPTTQHLNGLH